MLQLVNDVHLHKLLDKQWLVIWDATTVMWSYYITHVFNFEFPIDQLSRYYGNKHVGISIKRKSYTSNVRSLIKTSQEIFRIV